MWLQQAEEVVVVAGREVVVVAVAGQEVLVMSG